MDSCHVIVKTPKDFEKCTENEKNAYVNVYNTIYNSFQNMQKCECSKNK